MNLVAKEFVASRNDSQGVLILSELTGAASELSEAILVNPLDRREVGDAINRALTMPVTEQQDRMKMMQKRLKEYDVVRWMSDFLDQLQGVKKDQEKLRLKLLDEKTINTIVQSMIPRKRDYCCWIMTAPCPHSPGFLPKRGHRKSCYCN
jgi:trehalose 6-phosphate synthase/phosphatase